MVWALLIAVLGDLMPIESRTISRDLPPSAWLSSVQIESPSKPGYPKISKMRSHLSIALYLNMSSSWKKSLSGKTLTAQLWMGNATSRDIQANCLGSGAMPLEEAPSIEGTAKTSPGTERTCVGSRETVGSSLKIALKTPDSQGSFKWSSSNALILAVISKDS